MTLQNATNALLVVLGLLLAAACGRDAVPEDPVETVDVLISDGLVFDGSGGEPVIADLAVRGDRILAIGTGLGRKFEAVTSIDAAGRWVTPGFIDAHSHAELSRDYGRDGAPYLYQGITTVVLGLDGGGTPDIAATLAAWRDDGIGTNGLLFVGHGEVRERVMGRDDREPTADEMTAMKALVRRAMDEGAFGLSSGLFYVPGTYASTGEVIELARVAAEYAGAIYDTHDRDLGAVYQGIGYDASVREGIRIGEESGLKVIFSHYNLQGAHNYGRAEAGARYINDARARGVDVWAAQHPYTATQSNLRSYTIPNWAAAGGRQDMLARFDDPEESARVVADTLAMLEIRGGADKILFADPSPALNGRTLAEVAAERELPVALAVQDILRDSNATVMNLDLYDTANTLRLGREPWMMTCTDGRTPRPDQVITHPRTFGAFPRKMRMFVLDEPLLDAEFIVRSFSGLAADFYALTDRGYLREGYYADVVVLDPETYRDTATYDAPRSFARGVEQVLVNGQFALRDGESTGSLAGRPLARAYRGTSQ